MELGLLQVVVVVALSVGGGCLPPQSKNLASPEMTSLAIEERKDLLAGFAVCGGTPGAAR